MTQAITRHLLAAALLLQGVGTSACPICHGMGPAIHGAAAGRRTAGGVGAAD